MSSICYNLLTNFLLQNNMIPFLNLFTKKIIITVVESNGAPLHPSFAILEQYHRIGKIYISSILFII